MRNYRQSFGHIALIAMIGVFFGCGGKAEHASNGEASEDKAEAKVQMLPAAFVGEWGRSSDPGVSVSIGPTGLTSKGLICAKSVTFTSLSCEGTLCTWKDTSRSSSFSNASGSIKLDNEAVFLQTTTGSGGCFDEGLSGTFVKPRAPSSVAAIGNDTNPEAVVEIVEFGNYECKHSGRIEPTVASIRKDFGDKVKVTYMHTMVEYLKSGRIAAAAAEAARNQGKFWEMNEKLFANQAALTQPDFERYAGELGLDLEKFRKDLTSASVAAVLGKHESIRAALEVKGTPTFFVNGEMIKGAKEQALKMAVDMELGAAGDKKGDAYLESRLKERNPPLHKLLYAASP
jgi:predicted DsbA family dithiol-disulfide isomerase